MTEQGGADLDAHRVGAGAAAWGVAEVEVHGSVASTNDLGRDMLGRWHNRADGGRAADGRLPLGLVLSAHQAAGRGRSASAWSSPSGLGLWMSFVAPLRGPAERSLLPLRAGAVVITAVEQLTGARCGWKWPNDVFMGGRKLAGILCEGFTEGVVIGIGINLAQNADDFPPELRRRATSLRREGYQVAAFDLLARVATGMRHLVDCSIAELDDDLLEFLGTRDILSGVPLTAGGVSGTGAGITRQGLLRVQSSGRVLTVAAGHVELTSADDRNAGMR